MNDVRQSHECKITNLPPAPKPTDAVPILKKDIVCLDGKGFLLYNVLSPNECQYYMDQSDAAGYDDLQGYKKNYRNNTRVTAFSQELADTVFERIKPYLPEVVDVPKGGIVTVGKLRELNVRDNKELMDIPHDVVALMRPPLLLHTSIPAEVVPKVFLGGLDSATNMALLQHLRITHIILAIGSMQPHFPKSFSYLALYDAKDSASFDFSVYFDECAQFIESARAGGGGVLIHCRAGISRSPTIVLAYLMKHFRMRYEQALKLVLAKRSQALPNNGFREQLMQKRYEVKLFDMDLGQPENVGNVSLDFVTSNEDDGVGGEAAVSAID